MKKKVSPKYSCIVQKYGGATLSTPEKIVEVAQRIARESKNGKQIVAVVSAMGNTTNSLIALAHSITLHPSRRELDMLLSTGERVSMSLLTMSLIDHSCKAISFTGSQAGIMTDESHVNAFIRDVHAYRVDSAISEGNIVVLAGFQGVSPVTKEITTLGRGGSDTTAVAMAAYLNADRCEILKDVPSVFSADPKLVKSAKMLPTLTYDQMLEMTFWGAKVLHYRSVELAKLRNVCLYIGPAQQTVKAPGTLVQSPSLAKKRSQENKMQSLGFESSSVLAINSQSEVLQISSTDKSPAQFFRKLEKIFDKNEIARPQILFIQATSSGQMAFITAPAEILEAIKETLKASSRKKTSQFKISKNAWCSVSATCSGATDSQTIQKILEILEHKKISVSHYFQSAMSSIVIIDQKDREKTIQSLHQLIGV